MANAIVRRDYTARDFDSFLEKIKSYVRASFPNAANDFFEDHLLMVLAEVISYAGDTLSFFLDMAQNEVLWDTVGQRVNIVALAKLLGYYPRGISSAQVTLSCTTSVYAGTLSISKGTKITVGAISFEVSQNYAFNGDLAFDIAAIEGETKIDTFYSDGSTNQIYSSQYDQVSSTVDPIIKVDGDTWTPVNFLWEKDAGTYYQLQHIGESRIRILFGDGVHGGVPPDTSEITIEYLISKGTEGNLSIGSITGTLSGSVGGLAQTVTFTNAEASTGGAPAETVEEIRTNAPIFFQSLDVVTTAKDLRGSLEKQPGVIKASVTVDDATKVTRCYLVASGYSGVSQAQINAAFDDIREVLVIGAVLDILSATFPTADLTGRIYLKSNYSVEEVETSVAAALVEYFTPADPSQSPKQVGTDVYFSDVVRLLDSVEGVEYVNLDRLTLTPLSKLVIWATNSGTFDSVDIGSNSREEMWTVSFTSPTDFDVIGSVSGPQIPGVVGTPYVSDNGRFIFTIVAGSNSNQTGDYAEIRTSRYANNVQILASEFVLKGTIDFAYNYADE